MIHVSRRIESANRGARFLLSVASRCDRGRGDDRTYSLDQALTNWTAEKAILVMYKRRQNTRGSIDTVVAQK